MKKLQNPEEFSGLTEQQVAISRQKHGANVLDARRDRFSNLAKGIVRDPMLLLLVTAGIIYFITGNTGDAWFMFAAIIVIVSISLYQDRRSQRALDALRVLTQPNCRVIRNSTITSIPVSQVVLGDYLLAEEGSTIAADGIIQRSNDFAVDESVLTGESLPAEKTADEGNNQVFQGTLVTRGLAVCKVTAIGINTQFGKIGQDLASVEAVETPLQKQISLFVRRMAIIGLLFFAAVWAMAFFRTHNILDSLLKALSLAMSILPEEIPVAFVTFMAIGAWRLSKLGIIVKHISTIETLGSATVICADKTGTITKNEMALKDVYVFASDFIGPAAAETTNTYPLITYAMWASEPIPFDPMEVALHDAYAKITSADERHQYKIIHEYPLSGHPPFMTHVFQKEDGSRIIAAKGSPEAILSVSMLTKDEKDKVMNVVKKLSSAGARVLGVAQGHWDGSDFPATQNEIQFTFLGLVSFYDPPKDNIRNVLSGLYGAGINVKMITGDYTETAMSISNQIGLSGSRVLTGDEVMQLEVSDLQHEVERVNIFARTFPEAKLKILNALKRNGHIVAMTGDGINDASALKAAHIGVAMGKRGTEVAKQASAMILSDDDLSRMVDAVAAGRKVYANLKKAIQYIISIHIPIILVVFIPLLFNWAYPFVFTPVHIIFLELIMGPTCSIVYENEPIEKGVMHQKPRPATRSFFNWRELIISIVQGLGITLGAIGVYQYAVVTGLSEETTRTMVFIVLITANIFLTLVNRSLTKPFWQSIKYRNPLIPVVISLTIALTSLILFFEPVSHFFKVTSPQPLQLLIAMLVGLLSVVWIDVVKAFKRAHRYLVLSIAGLLLLSSPVQSQDPNIQKSVEENTNTHLRKFYESNNYSLAWTNPAIIQELITSIRSIELDGLNPYNYNLQYLDDHSWYTRLNDTDRAELDLALTQAFLDLAHDLYEGRVAPEKLFGNDWEVCPTSADYSGLLSSAINGVRICEVLDFLRPMDNGYEGLKYMLSNFRSIQQRGMLPVITAGDPMRPGDLNERIADVRTKLSMLGFLLPAFDNGDIHYDSILLTAVNRFQRQHGLTEDGMIGRKTQQALQLTADDYISSIVVNLEKYRWHQSRLLDRSIKINIPSFDLRVSEHERASLHMRVIIGRTDRPTPVLSSMITAMIINPTWTVPPTILKEDLYPAIRSDVGYLKRHSMRIVNSRGKEISPDSVNLSRYTGQNFPYNIQQDAGPNNPLGRIKFLFPNHHTVYLHDTNVPSLFASPERAMSSGCIRVESPMALVRLLTPATGWTEEMVRDQIDHNETKLVLVKDPLPIHITYFTTYVENNELYIMRDLYGYDKAILNALQAEKQPLLR